MSQQCNCGLLGEYRFPLSSLSFCPSCFSSKFEKRVLNSIPRFVRGHTVAIALSGGKDSTTLLHILHKYQHKLRIPLLTALVLEEEIPELQSSREAIIRKIEAKYVGIEFFRNSYTELFNYSLPSLVKQSDKLDSGFTPCAICGILRRHGILMLAMKMGVKYIAMGNTLEDEAETILLNLIRGNPWKNYREQIRYEPADQESLPNRFKPLSKISELTIQKYSRIHQIPALNTNCTFANRSLRSNIRGFLNSMIEKNPHVLHNIISSFKKERTNNIKVEKVYRCKRCSSYSPDPECSACRIIHKLMN
ncbi:MAG: ATP-binding protein [Candidatus Thorarchaeota archaeon]